MGVACIRGTGLAMGVYDWMSGNAPASVTDTVPYHLRRYVANQPNVPVAHFSVLTEMTQLLIAPMEIMGYTLPERLLPDISQGRMYCKWLRDKYGIDTDALPTYAHVYERTGGAYQPRPIPKAFCLISASISGKSGCQTARLNISKGAMGRLCSFCQS
jgi:hypothetical protein